MVKVLTYDIPDHKLKLKIRQFQVMGKKIQGKLIYDIQNTLNTYLRKVTKCQGDGVCRFGVLGR